MWFVSLWFSWVAQSLQRRHNERDGVPSDYSTVCPGADQREHQSSASLPLWGEPTGCYFCPKSTRKQNTAFNCVCSILFKLIFGRLTWCLNSGSKYEMWSSDLSLTTKYNNWLEETMTFITSRQVQKAQRFAGGIFQCVSLDDLNFAEVCFLKFNWH